MLHAHRKFILGNYQILVLVKSIVRGGVWASILPQIVAGGYPNTLKSLSGNHHGSNLTSTATTHDYFFTCASFPIGPSYFVT